MIAQEIDTIYSELFDLNFFRVDSKGYILWANETMVKASGIGDFYSIKGKHVEIFGEKVWGSVKKVVATGKKEVSEEQVNNKFYRTEKRPIFKGSELIEVIGFSIDITKEKQAELSKIEFVENMRHDLRTPFSGLVGGSEYLLSMPQSEKTKEFLGYIRDSAKELFNIHNDILEAINCKNNEDNLIGFSARELLLEIESLYISTIKSKGLTLDIICEPGIINTNRLRLKQILLNLVSNAVKFTEKGSIEITAVFSSETLIIQIKDTGIGIDESKHEYIFENFTKIKPSYKDSSFKGAGVGLYMVKQAVEKFNGKISLTSSLGKGSTFQVEIPLLLE